MVLKLSDLVKKSIDKGYGTFSNPTEKPWSQGNLSIIDLKTGSNPFTKKTLVTDNDKIGSQCLDEDHASLNIKPLPDLSLERIQPSARSAMQKPISEHTWWEHIDFSALNDNQPVRLLINYNLLPPKD